jgi:hypothetical protein
VNLKSGALIIYNKYSINKRILMRFTEIKSLIETTQLDEVSMSPSSLQKFANSPEAEGMLMGIEFEMNVPNIDTSDFEDGAGEMEPDYSENVSCTDINEIINFFRNGDFSNMGRGDADRVRDELDEEYSNWVMEQAGDYVEQNEGDLLSAVRENLEDVIDFELDKFLEEARAKWIDENEGEDSTTSNALEEIRDLSRQLRADATDDAVDILMRDASSSEYLNAYDGEREYLEQEFRNSADGDMEAWLSSIGVEDMQDASSQWDLSWPYLMPVSYSNGGTDNLMSLAEDFSAAMGVDYAITASGYHEAQRDGVHWIIEPDSSINSDDHNDVGLEFVSPPMPLKDGLAAMEKLISWAKSKGCTTNESTGLHMNISVPDYTFGNLDFVKLALFMGDDHVLEQFNRVSNSYCSSALAIVKRNLGAKGVADNLLQSMREHLNVAASKAVHSGHTDKYTSINTQTGYVEFRGPGGDYLNKDIGTLVNTALRLSQSLRIATDPVAYKKEYAKKLYSLVAPAESKLDPTNMVNKFYQYSMGDIQKEDLLDSLRKQNISRLDKKFPNGPHRKYEVVRKSNPGNKITVNAATSDEAIQTAQTKVNAWAGVDTKQFKATPTSDDATFAKETDAYTKRKETAVIATMSPVNQEFIRNITKHDMILLQDYKRQFSDPTSRGATAEQKEILLNLTNAELFRRKEASEAIGAIDDLEQLPDQFQVWARDIQNISDTELARFKTRTEASEWRGITNIQASIFLNVVVNEIARRDNSASEPDGFDNTRMQTSTWQLYNSVTDEIYATIAGITQSEAANRRDARRAAWGETSTEMRDLGIAGYLSAQADAIPENWVSWVNTLLTRDTDTINDVRSQIQSGSMNVGLGTSAAKNAVLGAIDNELRRRQDVADADDNSNANISLPPNHQRWVEDILQHSDQTLINVLNDDQSASGITAQQAAHFRIIIKRELRRRGISSDQGRPDSPAPQQAADQATPTPDNTEQRWRVGNHTYGRELVRAPDRAEAIRTFAFNNGISVEEVMSESGFVAELVVETNESINRIRKLAGLL